MAKDVKTSDVILGFVKNPLEHVQRLKTSSSSIHTLGVSHIFPSCVVSHQATQLRSFSRMEIVDLKILWFSLISMTIIFSPESSTGRRADSIQITSNAPRQLATCHPQTRTIGTFIYRGAPRQLRTLWCGSWIGFGTSILLEANISRIE